jgi:3-deoxy-7-phosphoheptulonate synthase
MIISMRLGATKEEVDHVCERIVDFGFRPHRSEGEERSVIGVVGVTGDATNCQESLEACPGVERVVRITTPYKFVSKKSQQTRTVIRVGKAEIGGDRFVTMAGPCSVESEAQIIETAQAVARRGATILRGGAYKPRTSPYEFQGMELEGLRLLAKAREVTGLAVITEVMSVMDVDLIAGYADIMQVGARNMQNFPLLKALGRCGRPVMLKRGLSATINELLMSAEYVVAHGNPHVMLCERGIRTFETATRNTCDIGAVPVLNELTHLPVILDPSHAAGRRSIVPALAKAAVAAGADGIIVEVHPNPEKALSDGAQSLTIEGFGEMMENMSGYIRLWETERAGMLAGAVN